MSPYHRGRLRIRRRAVEIMQESLPPTSAALLGGLLLGDRTSLPHDLDEAFRRAGVYHVLAVSGFNVALLASAVFALLVLARADRRLAATVAMVAVVAFAIVVGPEPSVLRAALMGVLVLGAILLDRESSVLNSLSLAAIVILALRPGDLRDPGFQLSFAATGGIVVAPLARGVVRGALGVSAAAQLAVLPITLAHFNQVSTIGRDRESRCRASIRAGHRARPRRRVSRSSTGARRSSSAQRGVASAHGVAGRSARGGLCTRVGRPPAGAALDGVWLCMRAASGWRSSAWRRRQRSEGVLVRSRSSPVAFSSSPPSSKPGPSFGRPTDGFAISVLDVGQGDAMVVELPDGRAILIDAGPGGPHRLDVGQRVIAPFLWNRGHLSLVGRRAHAHRRRSCWRDGRRPPSLPHRGARVHRRGRGRCPASGSRGHGAEGGGRSRGREPQRHRPRPPIRVRAGDLPPGLGHHGARRRGASASSRAAGRGRPQGRPPWLARVHHLGVPDAPCTRRSQSSP